jgi:carbamoyl-phosphate synthase large subunit
MFISVRDDDQPGVVPVARYFSEQGFELLATRGTAAALAAAGIPVRAVNKVSQGRPHIVDMIKNDEIAVIINTVSDPRSVVDAYLIRREALDHKVTNYTTLAAARAACEGHASEQDITVNRLQDLHLAS